jgi:hypothetical protein
MRLIIPLSELEIRLTHPNGFCVVNLPLDFEIVGSELDSGRSIDVHLPFEDLTADRTRDPDCRILGQVPRAKLAAGRELGSWPSSVIIGIGGRCAGDASRPPGH